MSSGFSARFNVLEGNSASADLMAELTPILKITPQSIIATNSASGTDADPTGVPAPSNIIGYSLRLTGFANPTAGGFVTNIPEPETYALMLAGLGMLGVVVRNRKTEI